MEGDYCPVLVVDSAQVYKEIPVISNQARNRPAGLVGIASVEDLWTAAEHTQRARQTIENSTVPVVLDAGTGMYLNAILLDVPLAPPVEPGIRTRAQRLAEGASNPRHAARAIELELAGIPDRGSIWEGDLRYDTTVVYLRPDRQWLDARISRRSKIIVEEGVPEAEQLLDKNLNPSVREAIGVRELLGLLKEELTIEEAEYAITVRTRQLSRRQMRWFDKLVAHIKRKGVPAYILNDPFTFSSLNCMHDIIEA